MVLELEDNSQNENDIPLSLKWNWSGWHLKKKEVLLRWPDNMMSMTTCSLNG